MEKDDQKKITSFMKHAQERLILKKAEEEERKIKRLLELEANPCPLTDDSVSSILVRLPIRSLLRSICVCKLWYNIVHNSVFIHDHVLHSELVILFQSPVLKGKAKASDFSVESSILQFTGYLNNQLREYMKTNIQFMDYVDGETVLTDFSISCLGKVIASCNGLLLIIYPIKNIGLIVLNPVTRKCVFLRLGTISLPKKESYGFVYNPSNKQYKVVHLFDDGSGYTSCEIMVIGERNWKMVDGPPVGLINCFEYRPVSAIGSLHWLPQKLHNDYIVSLETKNESFKIVELPTNGGIYDRVVELGDVLCFLSHEEMFKMGIWVMKSLSEETWTKLHTITTGYIMDIVPISGSRSGAQIIFSREEDATIYIYDFRLQGVFTVDMEDVALAKYSSYLPHVNSLVSLSV
ncbi:putative F-box protein At5g52610 [Silene latifolia]|uniref:putative F-box protein At5g52610 n=1 Tax=Silene latifolia TaxID=37657 RepID=UPI003D77FBF2